jgi:hypothetical protein
MDMFGLQMFGTVHFYICLGNADGYVLKRKAWLCLEVELSLGTLLVS